MKELAIEGGGWYGDGRFEQSAVTNTMAPPIAVDLVPVYLDDFIEP